MREEGRTRPAETRIEPLAEERVTYGKLLEWALVEPDLDHVRSTRRVGSPDHRDSSARCCGCSISTTRELLAEQTRFNVNLVPLRALAGGAAGRARAGQQPRTGAHPVNVHQLLSGAGPYDAITTEAAGLPLALPRLGLERLRPRGPHRPRPERRDHRWQRLEPGHGDVLLIHHSAGAPRLDELLALPNPKLLLYHNITPAAWLWDHAPLVATHCAIGHEQLAELLAVVGRRGSRLGVQRRRAARAGGAEHRRSSRC